MKPLTEWMLPAPAGHEEMVFFVDMSSTTAPQEGAATCWVWLELAQGKAPVSEPDAKWEWAQKRHHELMALYHKDLQRVGADLALLKEALRAYTGMEHARAVLKRWVAQVRAEAPAQGRAEVRDA